MSSRFFLGMPLKSVAGFGLIELLVAVSIMVVVTTVVLANHGSFTSVSLLRTQAYDMALRIREAQQSAVNAQGSSGNFSNLLGVRWRSSVSDRYDIFSTPFFEDGPGVDLVPTQVSIFGTPGVLDDRFSILCVRRVTGGTPEACGSTTGVFIVFKRPNFDALFYDSSGNRTTNVESVIFTLGRAGDTFDSAAVGTTQRSVIISRSGQITVQ